jgi:hypothetical protein
MILSAILSGTRSNSGDADRDIRSAYSTAGEEPRSGRDVTGCGAKIVGEASDSDADSGGVLVSPLEIVMMVGGGGGG